MDIREQYCGQNQPHRAHIWKNFHPIAGAENSDAVSADDEAPAWGAVYIHDFHRYTNMRSSAKEAYDFLAEGQMNGELKPIAIADPDGRMTYSPDMGGSQYVWDMLGKS